MARVRRLRSLALGQRVLRSAAWTLLVLSLAACAHRQSIEPVLGATHTLAEPKAPIRCLFQVEFQQQQKSGRFRMVLWEDAVGFRVVASDPIGRGLWIYDQSTDRGVWIDKKGKSRCDLDGSAAIQVEDFGAVEISAIPDLLLGRPASVPEGMVVEIGEQESWLQRSGVRIGWRRSHCEQSEEVRPSLDRYRDWPQVCAHRAGIGK